jgi:preprotein translocase SecF subunit
MFEHFVQRRKLYYTISAVVIGLGLLAMVYAWATTGSALRLGVDFVGGTRFEVQFEQPVTETELRQVFTEQGVANPTVMALRGQEVQNGWQIRTPYMTPEESQAVEAGLRDTGDLVTGTLLVTTMSPAIGHEVTQAAMVAILVAAAIILIYIMVMFRQIPNSVRYGACAVAAMFHDLLVILGFTAVMGMILGWEIDALFLTAVLTVVGFSLQDTIVVFDRIRENLGNRKNRSLDFETIANMSVGQVFKRSFITQLNAMFVMVAILLFGGAAIKPFIAVLFVGLLSGTYSSIFTAVPLLVSWEKRAAKTPSARTA